MPAEHDPSTPFTSGSPAMMRTRLRVEVNRVQVSGVLGEARLRRMFDYLAEKSLAGQSPKEIAIAMDVFGKSPDFDVSQDALVRVYIHKLRKALDDTIRLDASRGSSELHIPRGEYRLKVSAKAPETCSRCSIPATPSRGRRFRVLEHRGASRCGRVGGGLAHVAVGAPLGPRAGARQSDLVAPC